MHRNPTKCWDNYQLAAFSSCSASGFFEGLIQALLKHDRQQVFQHCHALGVALCTHRKPVQLALRSQPSSGSPPRPCLSHAGSAATTHTSDKRRSHTYPLPETDQTSERTQIRLCHPPQLHPPAYAVSLHYRSPYPQVLSPLSAPYSQVCPHLIKRRNRRAGAHGRPLVRHARNCVRRSLANALFAPLAYSGYARAYYAHCCGQAQPLRAHLHRLLFPLMGEPMLCAL